MPATPKRVLAIVAIEAFAFGMSVVLGVLWIVNPRKIGDRPRFFKLR